MEKNMSLLQGKNKELTLTTGCGGSRVVVGPTLEAVHTL